MWSAERDDLEADQGQRSHLSAPLIRTVRSLFQETTLDKELVCNQLISLGVLGRRGAVLRQMLPAESPALGSTVCDWKGKPILLLLLNVRYKLHSGGFDDNMVLPPGASSESWAWKQHQGNHLLLVLVGFFFEDTELFYHWWGSSAILGRQTTCPKITQHSVFREVLLAWLFLVF